MQVIDHGSASAPRPPVVLAGDLLTIGDIEIDLLAESSDTARHVPVCVGADGALCRDHGGRWGSWAALAILPPLIPGAPAAGEDDPPSPASVDHDALVVHTWPVPAPSDGDLE